MDYNYEVELMAQELVDSDPKLSWHDAYRIANVLVAEACK